MVSWLLLPGTSSLSALSLLGRRRQFPCLPAPSEATSRVAAVWPTRRPPTGLDGISPGEGPRHELPMLIVFGFRGAEPASAEPPASFTGPARSPILLTILSRNPRRPVRHARRQPQRPQPHRD